MKYFGVFLTILICNFCSAQVISDSITLHDIQWEKTSPASSIELAIPSNSSLMQGFMYKANGKQKHSTLLLLHGWPGNERNLDLAQIVRAHGWNVIYFNYRGSWGSQGNFSFENCVQDVINLVSFCNKYQDSLQIDTSNIVLFGHSMGGWVCLKALQQLPTVKKGFALSSWDIYGDLHSKGTEEEAVTKIEEDGKIIVLNTSLKNMISPVFKNPDLFKLNNEGKALANKQIIMLDEHTLNKQIADAIRKENKNYFDYQVMGDKPCIYKQKSFVNKSGSFIS